MRFTFIYSLLVNIPVNIARTTIFNAIPAESTSSNYSSARSSCTLTHACMHLHIHTLTYIHAETIALDVVVAAAAHCVRFFHLRSYC